MMKGVNLRLNATNKAGPGLASFNRGMKGVNKSIKSVSRSNVGFMKGMNANRRIIQQVGMQVSDLGVQIAGGQSAILSLTQNVPQVVQMFGAWGGILAAIITLIGTFTLVMIKSGKGINDMIPFAGALSSEFTALASAFGKVKEVFLDGVNLIINNLDVLFVSLSALAALMVGKFVFAFLTSNKMLARFNMLLVVTRGNGIRAGMAYVSAAGGAKLFAAALGLVRKAIMLTGIGALIIGASHLIVKLLDLKKATGSWAASFKLLGEIAKQTFKQIPTFALAMKLKTAAAISGLTAKFLEFVSDSAGAMPGWANSVVAAVVAATKGAGAAFGNLGGAFAAVMRRDFKTATLLAATSGAAAANAYKGAIDKVYVGGEGSFTARLAGDAEQARKMSGVFSDMGDKLLAGASDAIPAWKELKELLASVDSTSVDIRDMFGGENKIKEDAEKALNSIKLDPPGFLKTDDWEVEKKFGKMVSRMRKNMGELDFTGIFDEKIKKPATDAMKAIEEMGRSVANTMKNSIKGLIKGTKTFKEAMFDILDNIIDKMLDMALNPIFDAIAGGVSKGIGGFIGSLFPSFNGGGFTGSGPRTGGMDGKGGKLAVVHPNETVVDHTKGQTVGGERTINLNVYGVTDADSFRKSKHAILRDVRSGLAAG